jgi:hypothetical protein
MKKAHIIRQVQSTTDIILSKLQESLNLLNIRPAEGSNTEHMPCSHKVFGRTVNKKCLVSETLTVLRTS